MPTPTEKETSQTLPERPDERTARRRRSRILGAVAAAAALALIGFIIWGVWLASHPKAPPLQGQMDATTIDVAAKVPGRLETVNVKEGDQVSKGQVIATLYVPEIEAKVRQAEAYEKARQAQESLAQEGARPQEIQAAKAQYERAVAAEELAQKTYERISRLYREGFVRASRPPATSRRRRASSGASRRPARGARKSRPRLRWPPRLRAPWLRRSPTPRRRRLSRPSRARSRGCCCAKARWLPRALPS